MLCKWICSTDPEDWEPESKDLFVKEESDGPKAKKAKANDEVPKQLTKFILSTPKVNLFTHRQQDGKVKGRLVLTCSDISDSGDFAVVGFDDGVFLLVGLPSGELIQQLR